MSPPVRRYLTPEEYLALEEKAGFKSEKCHSYKTLAVVKLTQLLRPVRKAGSKRKRSYT